MKKYLKKILKQAVKTLGYEVTPLKGPQQFQFQPRPEDQFKWIQDYGIHTILDVGAHTGESALQFHSIFPHAKIYSFEPIPECFRLLESRTQSIPNHFRFNFAIGDTNGTLDIQKSQYSPSSSLLKMGDLHKSAYPFSSEHSSEKVEIRTLDELQKEIEHEKLVLLKIDTQGYEKHVLLGATETLKNVDIIIVETSFEELYESQPRFPEIYQMLQEKGFEYKGSWDQFCSPKNGRPLQQDGIFIRVESN